MVTTDDTNMTLPTTGNVTAQPGTSPAVSGQQGDFSLDIEEPTTSPVANAENADFVLDMSTTDSLAQNSESSGGDVTNSAADFSLSFDDDSQDTTSSVPVVGSTPESTMESLEQMIESPRETQQSDQSIESDSLDDLFVPENVSSAEIDKETPSPNDFSLGFDDESEQSPESSNESSENIESSLSSAALQSGDSSSLAEPLSESTESGNPIDESPIQENDVSSSLEGAPESEDSLSNTPNIENVEPLSDISTSDNVDLDFSYSDAIATADSLDQSMGEKVSAESSPEHPVVDTLSIDPVEDTTSVSSSEDTMERGSRTSGDMVSPDPLTTDDLFETPAVNLDSSSSGELSTTDLLDDTLVADIPTDSNESLDTSASSVSETEHTDTPLETENSDTFVDPLLESPSDSSLDATGDLFADMEVPAGDVVASTDVPTVSSSTAEYQPTVDAFDQTVSALNDAKNDGNTFISSEELPIEPVFSDSSTSSQDDKVLNLDQMVAKFHGDELPIEQDPFEPMKKALEEEEKKDLLKKGAIVDGVELITDPSSMSAEPLEQITGADEATQPLDEFSAPSSEFLDSSSSTDVPLVSEASNETFNETSSSEEAPAMVPSPETLADGAATLSLDELGDVTVPSLSLDQISESPVSTAEVSTTFDMASLIEKIKQPKVWGSLVGGLLVFVVILTMFPSNSKPAVENTTPGISDTQNSSEGTNNTWNIPEINTPETDHGAATDQSTDLDSLSGSEELGDGLGVIDETEIFPIDDPDQSLPFVEDPTIDYNQPQTEEIPAADMIRTFNSYSSIADQYLEIGRNDNDAYVVKNASYISYQATLLREKLESGETLGIDYYTEISSRMKTLLDNMEAYLNGTYTPDIPSQSTQSIDQEANRQELQDYVYEQNGVF